MWTRFFANLAPSWLAHHLVHPSVHLCTPLRTFTHPCTPLCFTFSGLVTLIQLSSDLGPLLATMGNPALVQPGTAPILDLSITKSNPHGPHATHLPSLWAMRVGLGYTEVQNGRCAWLH